VTLKRVMAVLGAAMGMAAVTAGSASAGWHERHEGCGAECYVKVHTAPVYGVVRRDVLVEPAVAYRHTVPASYAVVRESVLVSPAQVVWTRKRDHYGHEILCKVIVPARYALIDRQVMVRPPHHVVEIQPARYVSYAHTVKIHDGGTAWVPVGHRHHHRHWMD